MGKAEREGQHNWNRYIEAGVVDDYLNWTDDPIVVAHALGKTKETVGKCWPMDAAVAYTLASAGPDANLTSKQMVNQYTRTAAAMMSQTVGYSDGSVPDSRVKSCGHDEVSAYIYNFNKVYLRDTGHIALKSGSRMRASSLLGGQPIPEALRPLLSFRVSEHVHKTMQMCSYIHLEILQSPKFKPLREYIEETLGTKKWLTDGTKSGAHDVSSAFTFRHTLGVCKWENKTDSEGNQLVCAYHDRPKYRGWVLINKVDDHGDVIENRFEKMWHRGKGATVHSGWNRRQLRNKFNSSWLDRISPDRVVIWNRVSRGLANTIPEKLVIKEINAACRRMTARNFNVVTKEGLRNTATYTWKEWNWLANLKAWIAQTRQKNRKEHDLVNGWKWTKYGSRMSYGYEIANFKWVPGEVNSRYVEEQHMSVLQKGDQNITSYSVAPAKIKPMLVYRLKAKSSYYSSSYVDWVWRTKGEIQQFLSFLPLMAKKTGAVGYQDTREWDAKRGEEALPDSDVFQINEEDYASKITLDMDADPEDLPSSDEIFEALQWGSPQEFDEAYKLLEEDSRRHWSRPEIINEEQKNGDDEDGGATAVAN